MTARERFPERLRKSREIRRLTQAELAKKAGLPAASISHFETGTRFPSGESLARLADALRTSVDFLLGRTEGFDLPPADSSDPAARAIFADYQGMSSEAQETLREFARRLADLDRRKESS